MPSLTMYTEPQTMPQTMPPTMNCWVHQTATTTFQVYKYDSLAPAKNTCTLQSGASADTFSMTNWGKANNGAYLSGVRFAANKDMTPLTNVLQ